MGRLIERREVNLVKRGWYSSNLVNIVRRGVNFSLMKIKYKLGIKHRHPLKLHLGCGNRHIDGYLNIDWIKTDATDLVFDIRRLPYPDNSIELIETYHVIEHLPRHKFPKVLKEWYRVLIPGGRLIIECPDFDEALREYLKGNEKLMDSIFGMQRFPRDTHLFGYNLKRLRTLLRDVGFKKIVQRTPQDYHVQNIPCLRVESVKEDR